MSRLESFPLLFEREGLPLLLELLPAKLDKHREQSAADVELVLAHGDAPDLREASSDGAREIASINARNCSRVTV
ncbi:MAG TPA: hypothetical protein VM076_25375 [Gemmatimonadaceae bacterium]|nr:hypothetical protein [Gemmatimonadaceae bacterium]